ncbi:transposase, partial [Shigella flexneri]|nr:transposase [Shigella flexneri]EFX9625863.1 transposase [Shigella flexneri]EFY0080334.1 transposase [Shigella flexneri]EFY0346094.1 transposase [Shigella flexneri]EFY1218330.1 transposase [Shigella flexneri]
TISDIQALKNQKTGKIILNIIKINT